MAKVPTSSCHSLPSLPSSVATLALTGKSCSPAPPRKPIFLSPMCRVGKIGNTLHTNYFGIASFSAIPTPTIGLTLECNWKSLHLDLCRYLPSQLITGLTQHICHSLVFKTENGFLSSSPRLQNSIRVANNSTKRY